MEENKAMTIEDINNQEGPIEVLPDEEIKADATIQTPKNEQELVALVNVLGMDWGKIAAVLSKLEPNSIKADSVLNKISLDEKKEDPIISNIVGKKALRRVQRVL